MIIRKRILLPLGALALFCVILTNRYIDIQIAGHFEGLYLLKDKESGQYGLSDHLFVGQEKQLIYAVDLNNSAFRMARRLFPEHNNQQSHLHVEWNSKDGSGLVSSYFPDGTGLVTYLGRYLDNNKQVHGLFVGGGLPETVEQSSSYNMNNSGMTYFDGKRWYHIWCSVNEGIGSTLTGKSLTPSKWEFIGSGVERRSSTKVIISSSHRTVIDGVPVRIERRMHFTAGETFLYLEIRITNIGTVPVSYTYAYGDEPWLGYYGTSLGDVGWVQDRIVNHEEMVDVTRYSAIGMADIGNRAIGEQPVYTNLANFLEWFGPEQPKAAYFTNNISHEPGAAGKIPLESNERFLGLLWERSLDPSQSAVIRLAVGMALLNPKTGIPEKPPTAWQ